eukprot:TRINITY_DN4369_c0_g1_i1.p1 TRINITY_DN4369_c0_g1~~TRINITY_DN4369_c0_g1_i1.p1  ORF type:complete len:663 (-),score=194.02 TRINITY_DN4369_c0_g1_i1:1556-3544(-)
MTHRRVTNIKHYDDDDDYDDDQKDDTLSNSLEDYMYKGSNIPQKESPEETNFSKIMNPSTPTSNKKKKKKNKKKNTPSTPNFQNDEKDKLKVALSRIYQVISKDIKEGDVVEALIKHNFDENETIEYLLDSNKGDSMFSMDEEVVENRANQKITQKSSTPTKTTPIKKEEKKENSLNLSMSMEFQLEDDDDKIDIQEKKETEIVLDYKSFGQQRPSKKTTELMKLLEKEGETQKEHISIVVIGHVDAGKSTTMGRLMYEQGVVDKKLISKYEKESNEIGKGSFAYAWVFDQSESERSKGVTIEVSQQSFETTKKRVVILDAPGHLDFVPNMIGGTSQADFAILIIDGSHHFESGFGEKGQTREHAHLAKNLGVIHLIVAINKLDLYEWSENRYNNIVGQLSAFLTKGVGFKQESISFVPIGGLLGINLSKNVTSEVPKLHSWYKGKCLTQVIDELPKVPRATDKPFRLSIDDTYKSQNLKGSIVIGKVVSGIVTVGDNLLLMPSTEKGIVKSITLHSQSVQYAKAGQSVEMNIQNIDPELILKGNILCDPGNPIMRYSKFTAKIKLFKDAKPVLKGAKMVLHHHIMNVPVTLFKLVALLDKNGNVTQNNPRGITKNNLAVVEIISDKPLCLELFSENKFFGRFLLRDQSSTVAAGLVTQLDK